MSLELTGNLLQVYPQVERGTFTSRKIWLTIEDGQYPQTVELEISQKNVGLFNNITLGSEVTCSINIRGRKWNNPKTGQDAVFNTLQCWKVEVKRAAGQQAYTQPAQSANGGGYSNQHAQNGPSATYAKQDNGNDAPDDLPFAHYPSCPSLP